MDGWMDGLGIKNGRNGLMVVSYDVWVGGSGWVVWGWPIVAVDPRAVEGRGWVIRLWKCDDGEVITH